jgi:Skp family chaperone for outer membrane proteins
MMTGVLVTGFAQGQTAAGGANMKIGFVSSYDVLYGTDEGKQALDKLNTVMQDKQKQFDTQKAELDKLKDEFAQKERNLNPSTAAEMRTQIGDKEKALTRFQEDAQTEINHRRDELLSSISEKIQAIISDYAQQNNFGAILMRDPQVVTYIAPAMDVTPDIIKVYNQKHPAAAGTTSAAPATAAPATGAPARPAPATPSPTAPKP